MNLQHSIGRKVQLWALTGPLVALATCAILILKAPANSTYLLFALVAGFTLCWVGKSRGLAIAAALLSGLLFFNFSSIPSAQMLWHLGMALSILIGFVITALTFQEISQLLEGDTVEQVKLKELEKSQAEDKVKLQQLHKQITEQTGELESYKQLVDISRKEMLSAQSDNEKLHRDLSTQRQIHNKTEEMLHEAARKIEMLQDLANKAKSEVAHLKNDISYLNEQLHEAQAKNAQNEEFGKQLQVKEKLTHDMSEQIETLTKEKDLLQQTLANTHQEMATLNDQHTQQLNEAHVQLQIRETMTHDMSERIENLTKEKETLLHTLAKMQQEISVLSDQHNQRTNEYTHLNSQLAMLQSKADLMSMEKEQALQQLQDLRAERDALARDAAQKGQTMEGVSPEAAAWRQAEGRYNQLQEQFADKSAVLDETRKELFIAQEKLLQLQREMEECQTYTVSESEAALTKQLIQLGEEAVGYQKEVVALQEIIDVLVKK